MRHPVTAAVGDRIPAREIGPLTQTDIVRFAGAGGDFNPLHHDPEFARKAGFAIPIAMGQMQAGILGAWLTDWCGVEHLREYEVRFQAAVQPGDVLELSGEVVAITENGGHSEAQLTLTASRGSDPVVTAKAAVAVRS
ncbi:MaoC/PaaZ C-terminal domain-containing protein [Saccharopolyspora sp. ID03-671]|uniref:MaoC/PaaZ C-terminal domain-containing protein n=1 Tax=Saccharopolyspora sp. ID03-671 TaxID=3073066 RepID=UPI003250846A